MSVRQKKNSFQGAPPLGGAPLFCSRRGRRPRRPVYVARTSLMRDVEDAVPYGEATTAANRKRYTRRIAEGTIYGKKTVVIFTKNVESG